MISIMARIMLMLVITVCFLVPKAAAQSDRYPKMAAMEAAQAHELEPDLRIRVVTAPYFCATKIEAFRAAAKVTAFLLMTLKT